MVADTDVAFYTLFLQFDTLLPHPLNVYKP